MLDHQVTDLADRFIQVEFDERRKILSRAVLDVAQRTNSRGILNSSIHLDQVIQLCELEIDVRARIVLQIHIKVLADLAMVPYEGLAQDLKERLRYFLPHHSDYTGHAGDLAQKLDLLNRLQALAAKWEHAIKRTDAEIDLFVTGHLRRAKEMSSRNPAGGVTYNFNSPVGAFQLGAGAVATVIQTVQSADREALMKALDLLRDTILREDKIVTFDKIEVLELIEDGKVEVQKPKPNGTKLTSIMNTVSNAIQTVGTLQSAYQMLKASLLPFGIMLP